MPKKKPVWTKLEIFTWYKQMEHQNEKYFSGKYINQSISGVNTDEYTRGFSQESKKLKEKLVNFSLSSLAAVDGGEHATDILNSLGFAEGRLDTNEIKRMSLIILRAQVFETLLKSSDLSKTQKRRMFGRFLAQLLPSRDNYTGQRKPDNSNNLLQQMTNILENYEKPELPRIKKGND